MSKFSMWIKNSISRIDKTDRKKLIITIGIIIALIIKIIYPYTLDLLNKKYDIEESNIYSDNSDVDAFNNADKYSKNSKNKTSVGENSGNSSISNSKDIVEGDTDQNNINITVYITGAVSSPGVVTIKSDKRLDDAIKVLGGLSKDADYNRINLATKLEDGQHYIIPYKGDNTTSANIGTTNSSNSTNNTVVGDTSQGNIDDKININTADAKKLEDIPGVGPATAKKIIDYRDKNGKFNTIEDIKNVTGIGDKKFDNMKDSICI